MASTGMTERELRQRAISRALANGGGAAVWRLRRGLYKVESSSRPGTVHTVSVDAGGTYHCSCEAGLAGRVCWHQASVYIAKVEHASGARVTGAAPAPAPAVPANVVEFRQRAA